MTGSGTDGDLVGNLLDGSHRALARTITKIENRSSGYRELVSALYEHTGNADVIGITGSPGSGKSTLVDRMTDRYRRDGLTVGVIGVDPSSPFTGGAVLGDRIRMASTSGDMGVFIRSMSARGSLGGLSTTTADAVKALDAFGKDKIVIETVGAGQNEIDIVKTADTVCVIVPPGSGDDVQMLKAGILEIGDVFVVNKADLKGADRTVRELREMIEARDDLVTHLETGHHGNDATDRVGRRVPGTGSTTGSSTGGEDRATVIQDESTDDHGRKQGRKRGRNRDRADEGTERELWTPPIIKTVAKSGDGIEEFLGVLGDHRAYLERSGRLDRQLRVRYAEEIRTLLSEDSSALLAEEIDARGGIERFVDRVVARETDPYSVADGILRPLRRCVEADRNRRGERIDETDDE